MYSLNDEAGNQIAAGLKDYNEVSWDARRYLSDHQNAQHVMMFHDGVQMWRLFRDDLWD